VASHIAAYASGKGIASIVGSWLADMGSTSMNHAVVSLSFDGCSVKEAAARIADALGCNVFWDWVNHVIRFVAGTTLEGDSYDGIHILGGTRNMGKKALSGGYAAVTQRLTIDDGDSIIGGGGLGLIKEVVLDDIYPKMELRISSARCRLCYLTDESGKKISDGSGGYKQYAKWYIRLSHSDGTPYVFDPSLLINDKPLGILFQPDYASGGSCPLAGREFELVYFSTETPEWGTDDVVPVSEAFRAAAGEYRIVFQAEGDKILPTLPADQLVPRPDNKVTLVNMKCGDAEIAAARVELLEAGYEIYALMQSRYPEYTDTVIGSAPAVGSLINDLNGSGHGGIVVNVSQDVDTQVAQVTLGSWSSKTRLGSMGDKIDAVSTGGSGTATAGTGEDSGSAGMSETQFEALVKTTKKPDFDSRLTSLSADMTVVKAQADRQFLIWFGEGAPIVGGYPSADWVTADLKSLHEQDVYFDTTRQPGSSGGRAWRWLRVGTDANGNVVTGSGGTPVEYDSTQHSGYTYLWVQISDLDTLAALEKIADLSSDGIISGGTEKSLLWKDWQRCCEEYGKYMAQGSSYGLTTETGTYDAAFRALGLMLDGYNAGSLFPAGDMAAIPTPSMLVNLGTDTVLSTITYTENGTAVTLTPAVYRAKWNAYYASLNVLVKAIGDAAKAATEEAQEAASSALSSIADMGSDSKLTEQEKRTLKTEFISLYHEMTGSGGIVEKATAASINVTGTDYIATYQSALAAIGTYLNKENKDLTVADTTHPWSVPASLTENTCPKWLKEDVANNDHTMTRYIGETNTIGASAWTGLWAAFYSARTAILTRLSELAQSAAEGAQSSADSAHERIDDLVSDSIISGGTEKSQLRQQWTETVSDYKSLMAQAADYNTQGVQSVTGIDISTTAFANAYTLVAQMLNNGISPTIYILTGTAMPSWLTALDTDTDIAADTSCLKGDSRFVVNNSALFSGITLPAERYRAVWSNYYSERTLLTQAVSDAAAAYTSYAKSQAEMANAAIAAITDDGVFTVDEISSMKREFEAAYRERAEMIDLATKDSGADAGKLIDEKLFSPLNAYLAAFTAVANYLNMQGALNGSGTYGAWEEPQDNVNHRYGYTVSNGGTASAATYTVVAKAPLADGDYPSLMRVTSTVKFQADWADPTDSGDKGAAFNSLWAALTASRQALSNAMATLTKDVADDAGELAAGAMTKVNDAVSDLVITAGREKSELLTEWLRVANEYQVVMEQADDYGLSTANGSVRTALKSSFSALAYMLNGCSSMTISTIGYGNPAASATTITGVPLWIRPATDNGGLLAENTRISDYSMDGPLTAGTYRQLWQDYYNATAAVQLAVMSAAKAKIADAQEGADTANTMLADMASDSKIDPSEKIRIKDEFYALYLEMWGAGGILLQASTGTTSGNVTTRSWLSDDVGTKATVYKNAFTALATYMNGSQGSSNPVWSCPVTPGSSGVWTVPATLADDAYPLWLTRMETTETLVKDQSDSSPAETWRKKWEAFYTSRTAMLTALSSKAQADAVAAQATAVDAQNKAVAASNELVRRKRCFVSAELPVPPYSSGDLWYKLSDAGYDLYHCTTPKSSDGVASLSDWSLLDMPMDSVTNLLADLAELWELPLTEIFSPTNSQSTVKVFFQQSEPSGAQNDLWWNNSVLKQSNGLTWSTLSGNGFDGADTILTSLADMGIAQFSFHKNLDAVASVYDVYFRRAVYNDKFAGNDIPGAFGVWVRGNGRWTQVRDNTSSIMQSYGDHILLSIFGDDVFDQQTGEIKTPQQYFGNQAITSYASGITVAKNFAQIFASATNKQSTALAAIAALIEDVNNNGVLSSKVKITANNVEFDANGVDVKGTLTSVNGHVEVGSYTHLSDQLQGRTINNDSGVTIKNNGYVLVELYGSETTRAFGSPQFDGVLILSHPVGRDGNTILYQKTSLSSEKIATTTFAIANEDGSTTDGANGTFTTAEDKTVTVTGGIITSIS